MKRWIVSDVDEKGQATFEHSVESIQMRQKVSERQEVTYDSLLTHQERVLHAAVGRAIEQQSAQRIDHHADLLSFHCSRVECWEDAVKYAKRAAG